MNEYKSKTKRIARILLKLTEFDREEVLDMIDLRTKMDIRAELKEVKND